MADIATILQNPDFKIVVEALSKDTIEGRDIQAYIDEYKGKRERRDTSVDNREDKEIDVYSDTEMEIDANGDEVPKKTGTETVTVARVHTNIPKKIVRTAAAFLFGGEMNISWDMENDGTKYFKTLFEKRLKMQSVFKEFARTVMVETKSALLFYPKDVQTSAGLVTELRVRVLKKKNGDFYPHFDDYGDMDAFIRKYVATAEDGQEHDHVWIQTADQEILGIDMGGSWVVTSQTNIAGKILVVYADQDTPEWEDIVSTMDALEMRFSRLIDTNDYFSEPILKSYGQTGLPTKSTVGKDLNFDMKVDPESGKEYHGDADYLVWQQSVESIKLEMETERSECFSGTSTPDIAFENLKGIGDISGTAMRLMFLDAYIKAQEKMEIFAPAVQRAVSVIIAGISTLSNIPMATDYIDNSCEVTFGSILPDDLREEMEVLSIANGNKPINSQRTITARSRFTKDVQEEITTMQSEEQSANTNSQMTGLTFPGK